MRHGDCDASRLSTRIEPTLHESEEDERGEFRKANHSADHTVI